MLSLLGRVCSQVAEEHCGRRCAAPGACSDTSRVAGGWCQGSPSICTGMASSSVTRAVAALRQLDGPRQPDLQLAQVPAAVHPAHLRAATGADRRDAEGSDPALRRTS